MTTDSLSIMTAHVAEIISVLLVLLILSGKREARSTLVWLLLVIFLPYVGAFLYLFFGRLRPEYPAHKIHPALHESKFPSPAADYVDQRTNLTNKISGTALVHCDELTLLRSAEVKYEKLLKDIAGAKVRISLCYYVFRLDNTGLNLLELLAEKAQSGVEVRLLYDGYGALGLHLSGGLKPFLRRGVRAMPFAPVTNPLRMSRINFRNHRKIAVIDGKIGYTGSTNIGDEYLGGAKRDHPWRDLHVRLTGEAAAVLEEVFAEDWRIATREKLNLPLPPSGGPIPLHVIPTGPDMEEDRLFPLLFAHLTSAEKTIDIATPYLVPNQALVAALSVAARKGVRVRVLLPKKSNHPMVAAAGRSYYEELIVGGVEIYEMPNAMLHAKTLVIDGNWVLLGSANFDNRSFFLNFEINLALGDEVFVQEISNTIAAWIAVSERATMEYLAARTLPAKLFDSICRTLSPVL